MAGASGDQGQRVAGSGWVVPGYTELKLLGSGGFGTVVLARHDATGTAVAVKYLLPGLGQDPEFAALFRVEAEALGALNDPHVVRLYEYVESAAGAAIVMELVDGVTLWDILSRQGPTTPEAALVVLYGSLLGLAAAHARGVVHRDFKPRNVLVNAYGASKLTDFGIAARAGTPTVPSGSVAYAPPEQFDGGLASPASDVYAATATFYECLAGRPPFTGTTVQAVIQQHHSAPVPMDPVPEPLQPIVARGMAKDPRYRPSDAAALAAALRAAAVSACGPDWEQRGRQHLGAAALLLAALWPSAGIPALHASAVEQVHLAHGAQPAHGVQAAHHPAPQAGLHRWHVRHMLHLRRVAAIAATAAVVAAAAIAAVAYSSRPPGGPGPAGRPAVTPHQAPLASAVPVTAGPAAAVPATLIGTTDPAGDTYVLYDPHAKMAGAFLSGAIAHATTGEVAQLYAQQFPYTSPPEPAGSVTLHPNGGTAAYSFTLSPALATRYQVRLLRSTAAATPLAVSAIKTVYVVGYAAYFSNPDSAPINMGLCPAGQSACTATFPVTVYVPPAALRGEMSQREYVYRPPAGTAAGRATSLQRDNGATISAPQRVGTDAYEVVVSLSSAAGPAFGYCTEQTEAQDGIGLPGPSACGSANVPATAEYIWGGAYA
jgi:eukaryotic-like serine/threonine-protein kinase